jgi:hypothetical protein
MQLEWNLTVVGKGCQYSVPSTVNFIFTGTSKSVAWWFFLKIDMDSIKSGRVEMKKEEKNVFETLQI